MKPIADWRRVLRHAWSVRLASLAVIFQVAEAALPFMQNFIEPGWFAALSMLATTGAIVARFMPQKEFPDADQ